MAVEITQNLTQVTISSAGVQGLKGEPGISGSSQDVSMFLSSSTFNTFTSSIQSEVNSIKAWTASLELINTIDTELLQFYQTTASLNTQTGSQNSVNLGISTATGSLIGITNGLMAFTAALDSTYASDVQLLPILQATHSIELHSGSMVGITNGLMTYTSSNESWKAGIRSELSAIEAWTSSLELINTIDTELLQLYQTTASLNSKTGSYATTGSNTFYGTQNISGSLNVSGSTVQIGNNILTGNTTLSGSINVSGSTTFNGTHILSGSNTIDGNTIMTGTNTIIGNTVMSGSIEVSGSSNFKNSIFIVTGSTYFTGSHDVKGNTSVTGSFNINGNTILSGSINVASGSGFYRAGNKLFNYGQWGSLETQSGSANVANAMKFETSFNGSDGIIVANNGSGFPTRITAQHKGLYNIQFSAQLHTTATEACQFSVWFVMTGSNIMNSNTEYTVEKISGGGNSVAALNLLTSIEANDWIELYWSNVSGNGQLQYIGTQSTPTRPATPSVIVTITQVA